jgi:hypothetical protein
MEDDRILVSISCYDVLGEGLTGGFLRSWRFNLGFYNSLHIEVADLLTRIRFAEAPPQPVEVAPRSGLREMTFTSSLEGMEVYIAGETKAGAIQNGRLVLYTAGIEPGSPLVVEKRREGYHTAWQTVQAAGEIPLSPLTKQTSYAVEVDWTFGQLLGFGSTARLYFIPDFLFGGLSVYAYAQVPNTPGGVNVLHSDVGLLIGQYLFFPADFPFRLGISTGCGGIFSQVLSPGLAPFTDFYLNIVNVWLELNLPGISFFLRSEMKYSLGIGNNALGRDMIRWEFLPPITFGVLLK